MLPGRPVEGYGTQPSFPACLHAGLCLFQSDRWHTGPQYCTALHPEHAPNLAPPAGSGFPHAAHDTMARAAAAAGWLGPVDGPPRLLDAAGSTPEDEISSPAEAEEPDWRCGPAALVPAGSRCSTRRA